MNHLTDSEFERACAHLARTYGLDMRSKRVLLECRLSRERERLKLPSFTAYLNLIESGRDPEASERFVDLVTTHYTYFFRERKQFAFLHDVAFPALERARQRSSWNILCAGCSTGEECYSLSMLVEDYAQTHDIPSVRIFGIDVSEPSLREARAALYPRSRIEKVPKRWMSSYLEESNGGFTVSDRIRKRVSFGNANLGDPASVAGIYDLILCRNVTIYFDGDTRNRVLDTLHRHLAPSSYLVLGHAEIIRDRTLFAYCGNSIYQKQSGASS